MRFSIVHIVLLILCIPRVHSQASSGGVTGIVQTTDNIPATYANVLVFNVLDSTFQRGNAADSVGLFVVNGLPKGTFWLEVTYLGFETYRSAPFQLDIERLKDFGMILLNPASSLLAEVTVRSERPLIEVQPDKTVFNVEGSINGTGNTALELLRKSPGVIVDNNNNIILAGKSGVTIHIDGKPTYLSNTDLSVVLNSMQSTEIDAIEIITNPGVKYEAEGNAGIINIRLKKDKSLGMNASLNVHSSLGTYAKYGSSLSFNSRSKKVNIFGTFSHNNGQNRSWLSLYRTQGEYIYDDYTVTVSEGASNNVKLGADLFTSDKATFGFLLNGSVNNRDWKNENTTPILNTEDGQRVSFLEALTENDGLRTRLNANINYRYDNNSGSSWQIDMDWGIFRNDNTSYQPNYFKTPDEQTITQSNIFSTIAPTDIDIYTFELDHERKLGAVSLESGLRLSFVETDNTFDFYQELDNNQILDTDRSNNFLFDERINAAYVSTNYPIGKWVIAAGIRAEQTISEGKLSAVKTTANSQVKRNYLDFFPSVGLTLNADLKNQFRLNYSRRIDRPSYQDLNPFEFKLSELSYSRGNPFLSPQYTQSISLSHTHNYRLTTSLTYSNTSDFFANISDSTEVIRTFLETINLDYQKTISLSISYPFSPIEVWSTYTSFTAYRSSNKAELGPGRQVALAANVASLYHQSTFSVSDDWNLELSGWYSSPSIWGAVYETDAIYSIDVGIQKKFHGGRGNIKLSLTDIFNSASWTAIQDFAGFYVDAAGGWESRQIRLNVSFMMGNNQLKKSNPRKSGIDKEVSRIK